MLFLRALGEEGGRAADLSTWRGLPAEGGRVEHPRPLAFGSERSELGVWSPAHVVWAEAVCGTHKCRFTKAIESGLGGEQRISAASMLERLYHLWGFAT